MAFWITRRKPSAQKRHTNDQVHFLRCLKSPRFYGPKIRPPVAQGAKSAFCHEIRAKNKGVLRLFSWEQEPFFERGIEKIGLSLYYRCEITKLELHEKNNKLVIDRKFL